MGPCGGNGARALAGVDRRRSGGRRGAPDLSWRLPPGDTRARPRGRPGAGEVRAPPDSRFRGVQGRRRGTEFRCGLPALHARATRGWVRKRNRDCTEPQTLRPSAAKKGGNAGFETKAMSVAVGAPGWVGSSAAASLTRRKSAGMKAAAAPQLGPPSAHRGDMTSSASTRCAHVHGECAALARPKSTTWLSPGGHTRLRRSSHSTAPSGSTQESGVPLEAVRHSLQWDELPHSLRTLESPLPPQVVNPLFSNRFPRDLHVRGRD